MLTVVMATHNGARTLPLVLSAHCGLRLPPGGWALVVVDNGSTDATGSIVCAFRDRLPVTHLWQSERGQNRARNLGLTRVAGDLVVFTDDDAVPDPAWLVELRTSADSHPEFAIFGGVIRPRWDVVPSEWLLRSVPLSACFAITDRAWAEGPIHADLVFSPNMAIKAHVFAEGYRFDESMGPQPGEYPMGSETDLTRRLTHIGLRAWHCRSAVVEHLIPASHLRPEWLLARAVRHGRGSYRLSLVGDGRQRQASGLRFLGFIMRGFAIQTLLLARAKWWHADPAEVFAYRWHLHWWLGYAAEAGLVPWRLPSFTAKLWCRVVSGARTRRPHASSSGRTMLDVPETWPGAPPLDRRERE